MRDNLEWKEIASYYIETLFYHELSKEEMKDMISHPYTAGSNTQIFMKVLLLVTYLCTFIFLVLFCNFCCYLLQFLNILYRALEEKKIKCYWQRELNLLNRISPQRLKELKEQVGTTVKTIDDYISSDSTVIARQIRNYFSIYFEKV